MSDSSITLELHNRQQAEREKKNAYMAARYAANPEKYKAASAARRVAKPEEVKESGRKYIKTNIEKVRATQLAYRSSRREEKKAYAKAYREENPEKTKAAIAAWYAAHPDAMRVKKHNRRERMRSSGKLSIGITEKLMSLQRGRCACCSCNLSISGHHLDHIMPVSKGGANKDDNIQLLCPPCNLEKHAKHPIDWAQERGRLL